MALIKCKECEREISNKANRCPHCGYKEKSNKMIYLIIGTIIVIALVVLAFILVQNNDFGSNKDDEIVDKTDNTPKDDDLEEGDSKDNGDEIADIDVAEYKTIESYVSTAGLNYALENNLGYSSTVEKISIKTLMNYDYILKDRIKDPVGKGTCDGYALVTADALETVSKGYIKCSNYTTFGYLEDESGAATIRLEDYRGQNYEKVKAELEAKGISVFIEKRELNGDEKIVTGQSPAEGTLLKKGDTVTLYIPQSVVTYPDFTKGYSLDGIKAFCNKYGVHVVIETRVYAVGYDGPKGILMQSKKSGSEVIAGDTIVITVGE